MIHWLWILPTIFVAWFYGCTVGYRVGHKQGVKDGSEYTLKEVERQWKLQQESHKHN